MALTGDRIGVPGAEEAPVVLVSRWKQPIAGIVALIWTLLVSVGVWYLVALSPLAAAVSLLGGFGLMAVLFAIWFENWPFYKLKTPWKVGIAATVLNVIVTLVFFFLASMFAIPYAAYIGLVDPAAAIGVGWSIFGSLSASCFSFAVLWVAGTMYWPWFDKKQPGRGVRVFILGWIITLVVWFFFFFPYGNPAATPLNPLTWVIQPYGFNMGWTQWTIFFSLLTLMTFEYWPWNKAGKQPKIGIVAFILCAILGFVMLVVAGVFGATVTLPLFIGLYGDPGSAVYATSIGFWNMAYADWLIVAVIFVSLFFDNWPKGYSQKHNLLIRFITVLILGTVLFFTFYMYSPFLHVAFTGNPFYDPPTNFLLIVLWVQLVFAYLWRKWPIYKSM
ncbi:MAG: hypothetical protein HXY34_03300 [Candidatus Thorarchaeota archaeon]|nr:hypothetical protein [Candidatus Thorarchaeota archaeon]